MSLFRVFKRTFLPTRITRKNTTQLFVAFKSKHQTLYTFSPFNNNEDIWLTTMSIKHANCGNIPKWFYEYLSDRTQNNQDGVEFDNEELEYENSMALKHAYCGNTPLWCKSKKL